MKKHWIFVFLVLVLLIRCASVKPPAVLDFSASQTQVTPGTSVEIIWNVENSSAVDIKGIGANLPPRGSQTVVLNQTQTFVLLARNGEQSISKELTVVVKQPEVKEEPKKSTPAVEKRSTERSNYLKGITNIGSVKPSDELFLNINLIDAHNFPKEVVLYCTVRDQYGNQIANLAPPYNYNYVDNWKKLAEEVAGKDYYIEKFNVQEVREDVAPPYSVSFVLDYSGSMVQDIGFLENALKVGLAFLRKGKDDFTIVQFDHRVFNPVQITENTMDVSKILPFYSLGGYTAFYDASVLGLNLISNSSKEKVAILFTDGGDNASFYNIFDAIKEARNINAKVFIIGFNRPFGGFLQSTLELMALSTGGKAYFPQSVKEFPEIFSDIFNLLNVYYIVKFSANKGIGDFRTVKLWFEAPVINKTIFAEKKFFVTDFTQSENIIETIKNEPSGSYVNAVEKEEQKSLIIALFEYNKSSLRKEDDERLTELAKLLKENPNRKIKIIGHTDTKGSDQYNQRLSLLRAKAVAKKLLSLGVNKKQIVEIIGMGKKAPIYPNETEEYQFQENRRVEIKFL